ncbi:arginyl-tRNA synthetase [Aquimarina sp. EL_43]|uniref:arginine--tRNA ligase n=1 Tax=unclassified Aquimarina TaxID=2627091 RepID=UPI0018CA55A7|nr:MULTISPECIES: arginine--tRNA ligase [unclassified Aquimarina]MBG6131042.1 arginyl-tRNA synthetase [Aquimarina sp. EL_35]MBG6151501.1 arginyl-tRNA synthetase [Aquimarina sp. EL_32]MBG6169432.1 arginyl-tRNA synthetase [Aquimarina sp. EL_43]
MSLQQTISEKVKEAIQQLYSADLESVELQATRKEFEGDITVVVFPMLRVVKGNPVQIGESIGKYLVEHIKEIDAYNVVKGFLNLVISDSYYLNFFAKIKNIEGYGFVTPSAEDKAIMVEYSSPNTNKPLHLGHVRNNLLGYAVAEIIKASGKKVYKTQIINDRGIHICKSMLAWQKYGDGKTPESTGLKGDKLVGNYYVKFDKVYKDQIAELISAGKTEEDAKKEAPILVEAQEMLRKWEAGDEEVVKLWEMMNGWVYDGFDQTYKTLGVDFDSYYYESNTYLLGKDNIEDGLATGVFFKKEDGSVWCDLTDEGLDEKIVLRSDGTAVYMTQDIGTAIQRVKDNPDIGGMIYTVGNEQDYHFKVLFLILKKLGYDWAQYLHHLSYGMVDLPSGKMKSREGTVVDADDLITQMATTAGEISKDLGKLDGYTEDEKAEIYRTIGLGALKYFILKVDPKKRILFNPEESVDFQGNTGPFIQYTYARIQAILRKADFDYDIPIVDITLHEKEKELIKQLELYPEIIQNAANELSPAIVSNYTYDLVKSYNSFFQNVSIFGADTDQEKIFRVQISSLVGKTIKSGFKLLGINVPERM